MKKNPIIIIIIVLSLTYSLLLQSCNNKGSDPSPVPSQPINCNYAGEVSDGYKSYDIVYDSINRFKKVSFYNGDSSNTVASYITFMYDSKNRLIRNDEFDNQTNKLTDYHKYTYNADSTLASDSTYSDTSAALTGNFILEAYNIYSYNASKQITRMNSYDIIYHFLNNTSTVYFIYSLDVNGNVSEAIQYNSADNSLLQTFTYTYDSYKVPSRFIYFDKPINGMNKNNRLTEVDRDNSGTIFNNRSSTFTYNSDGKPITETANVNGSTENITYLYTCN
jgi:hypothetical protein